MWALHYSDEKQPLSGKICKRNVSNLGLVLMSHQDLDKKKRKQKNNWLFGNQEIQNTYFDQKTFKFFK